MTNEEHNTALYQKMFAEQETFRDWLKDQPPEEILMSTPFGRIFYCRWNITIFRTHRSTL